MLMHLCVVPFVGLKTLHSQKKRAGARPEAPESTPIGNLTSDQLEARAREAVGQLDALLTDAISNKVDRLAGRLLAKGLVTQDAAGNYVPKPRPMPRPLTGYARARNAPGKAWRKAEFGIRRRLNLPRADGSKAFRSGGDARTLQGSVLGPAAFVWSENILFRTGFNAATSGAPGAELPAGGLEGLGLAGGVAAGCTLLDGLDMFNTFLDTVDEQERWQVEVVVFHRHFKEYLANRKSGVQSSPEVVHGFRRCQAALTRCVLFDKSARQAWKRVCVSAFRDTGVSSLSALLSTASTGMKIHSGADLASLGLGVAGLGMGGVLLPLLLVCAGIDAWVGLGEFRFRKKEYRRCKAQCRQLQFQITELSKTDANARSADHEGLILMLKGALKRQRRLRKQARYEMVFGIARFAKGVGNGVVAAPLAAAALSTGALATAPVSWPLIVAAGTVGGFISAAYLGSYVVKAGTREEMRARSRPEQYDATILATTLSAADRAVLRAQKQNGGALSVAGTQGYWTGGRDGFAGRYIRVVKPDTQVAVALDEFAGLLARRPAGGYADDPTVEAHIKAVLATVNIDEVLFNDIERMIRARSDGLRQQGTHPRDIEWHELMARREQYAAAWGLPSAPPKLPIGALLPSFHAACWIARLSDSNDCKAQQFVGLLDQHLRGEQVDLHAMNEWLHDNHHLAPSSPLTRAQMQAAAGRLFRSVPPTLFMEQMKALLKAIDEEAGHREAFGWQDDSPVHRELAAFCAFAEKRWIPGHQALSRACADSVGGVAKGARTCTAEELSTARRHLASGGSMPPSQEDRRALEAVLRNEWTRRFTTTRGARRRISAMLAEHCAIHGKLAGRTWSSDSKGGFRCDLGGRKVAVIRAAELATWVTRGDWNRPLPIEIRSLAPASAMRWLSNEPGADVDERFIGEAGVAATLENLKTAFMAGPHNSGKRLHERLISDDGIPPHLDGNPEPSQFEQLKKRMGTTRRVALAAPFESASTRPWGLLENTTAQDGAEQWQLKVVPGGEPVIHPSLDKAVQAYCRMSGLDAVRAVFIADPA
jgi:hypothetical protein